MPRSASTSRPPPPPRSLYPVALPAPPEEQPPGCAAPHTVLVLGGGGMRGMAHVGVIRVLDRAGIRIDAIVGTSIGALIGARLAMGSAPDDLEVEALAVTERAVLRRNMRALLPGGITQCGVYDGEHYRALIRRVLDGATFPSLAIPLRVNALSLIDGRERWFGWGAERVLGLVDAVYASGALPLIFPPLAAPEGDILVDGGLRTMVGVAEAVRWGARRIVAVDVSELLDADTTRWQGLGLAGIHSRVVQVLGEPQRAAILSARSVPTVHIRPEANGASAFTFTETEALIDAGETAARRALASPEAAGFHALAPRPAPRARRAAREA